MRYFEIALKIAFLVIGAAQYISGNVFTCWFLVFIAISFVLGIVLLFNKKSSYNFKQTKQDLLIRKVEGWVLIATALCYAFVWSSGAL